MSGVDLPEWSAVRRAVGRHALAAVVQHALEHVPRGASITVAASGGADSTALSLLVAAIARRRGWSVQLATVDHGLRDASALDADFVQSLGAWMGVPVRRAAVRLARGKGLAARAREARYRALVEAAREAGCTVLLLAHHAEDQLETVLMRLVRGAGAAAAGGMPARRRAAEGLVLVRPLLERSRDELRAMLRDAGVPWREDPGNADRSKVRGRLRHEVLPVLESLRKGSAVHASRAARRVRGAAAALRRRSMRLLQGHGPWSRAQLRRAGAEALALALRRVEPLASEATIERMVRAVRDDGQAPRRFRIAGHAWKVGARQLERAQGGSGAGAPRGSLAVDQ